MLHAGQKFFLELAKLLAPPPKLTVSQWADQNRRLSRKSSARGGEWKTRPYQFEPMDAFNDPTVHTIVLKVAIQTLKTETILNCLGYAIDQDPGPTLLVHFRDTDCAKFSKIRLAPMIEETPCLHSKIMDPRKSKKSDNTLDYKEFAGGHLSIVASGSPGNLAALPIRYLFCDEIDKYPESSGNAGDPISLAQGRQEEFWNRKTILACSPTVKGKSRIETAYEESDRREYELCCPKCKHFQIPKWTQVKWDSKLPRHKQPSSALYHCSNCDAGWTDVDRWDASRNGRFRATAEFNGVAGFSVSGLARLGTKLSKLVDKWLSAQGHQEAMKTFINEQLCELWSEPGETVEWERLVDRREPYEVGVVPAGGLILTCGVDVQRANGGRLEAEILALGENRETWSVDYRILYGNPNDPDVWNRLELLLHERFPHESGAELMIERMFVDSGDGSTTRAVYEWVQKQPRTHVWAVKGDRRTDSPVGPPRSVESFINGVKVKHGALLRNIDVDFFKSAFYADLLKRKPTLEEINNGLLYPQGYCHFPIDEMYGDNHFKQICAEQMVTHQRRGKTKTEFVKLNPSNEALDCRVYAMAAAWDCGVHHFHAKKWESIRNRLNQVVRQSQQTIPKPQPNLPQTSFRPIIGRINL